MFSYPLLMVPHIYEAIKELSKVQIELQTKDKFHNLVRKGEIRNDRYFTIINLFEYKTVVHLLFYFTPITKPTLVSRGIQRRRP